MASLRPTSRLLTRQLNRLTTIHTPTSTSTSRITTTRTTTHILQTTLPHQPRSHFHTTRPQSKEPPSSTSQPQSQPAPLSSGIPPSKLYTFTEIQTLASQPPSSHPHKILIDVREPAELLATGRIPGALNIPIKTAPDAFFLGAEEFEERFGFARPGSEDEVVFYCKAGVRSKAAARLAGQAGFGGVYGEFPGSMDEWVGRGGEVQRE